VKALQAARTDLFSEAGLAYSSRRRLPFAGALAFHQARLRSLARVGPQHPRRSAQRLEPGGPVEGDLQRNATSLVTLLRADVDLE